MNLGSARRDLEKMLAQAKPSTPVLFDLSKILFPKQLAYAADTAQYGTADCSRRAGKTHGIGCRLLKGNLQKPRAPSLYINVTREAAKRTIWPTLLRLNYDHKLGFEPVESDLIMKRNGIAALSLVGANNAAEIQKIRGPGWGEVAIDEAQTFPQYIKSLAEDVIMPSLADHQGSLYLAGTPNVAPVGWFYERTRDPEWSHHSWTAFDNPHIDEVSHIAKVLKLRGLTKDDPSIQREFYGVWAYDPNSLVFRFDAQRNIYSQLPPCESPWQYVLGIDVGYNDADAIAVLAFNPDRPDAYLAEEHILTKQTVTQLAELTGALVTKYEPAACVMDTGGLGRKIAEEMRIRFGLPIKAAEKTDKQTHIELLNDALRSGRFFVPANSRFGQDALLVEWDRDKSKPDKLVISDRYHSDICDAVLYAFRECMHWMHEPKVDAPPLGSPQAAEAEAQAYWQQLEREHQERKEEEALWAE